MDPQTFKDELVTKRRYAKVFVWERLVQNVFSLRLCKIKFFDLNKL